MSRQKRVQKFRSIEDMNAAVPMNRGASDFDRFLRHCARYWRLAPRAYPRGVFKFRSIEEAQLAREHHHRIEGPASAAGKAGGGVEINKAN